MTPFRVVAIPTAVALEVRKSQRAPGYGHPAHTEVATGYGPCRQCLRTFGIGSELRTLFTYDAFQGFEQVPLPGPIFIHAESCNRYPEESGYPGDMLTHPAILTAYAKGQTLIEQLHVFAGGHEGAVQRLLECTEVDYIEVRDKQAGCYDFRIQRTRGAEVQASAPKEFKC